ncbi:MAG: DUF1738 domain-containing protein [Candidatus Competibacteraceae bacterium]|nr:DUF1738 domain-containing protein [Candidatus Competibacteraceae bacterium]
MAATNKNRNDPSRADVYARVTDSILKALEAGARPWFQPWASGRHAAGPISRPLRWDGTPYRGINVITLWATAMECGFNAPFWMTYKQAQELGGQVKKGEHGAVVVFANAMIKTETDGRTGEDMEIAIPYMKGYTAFNVEQIDGLPERFYATHALPERAAAERNAALDAFFSATQADIRHGGDRAFYAIEPDFIQMPPFESFRSPEDYYVNLAHECAHWTRHPSRLDRDLGQKRWGDAGYVLEELVAEIGSAFLCAELGLTPEVRDDHAAYVADWLRALKNDKRAIFTAASHAQKAADFLLAFREAGEESPVEPLALVA